MRLYLRVFHYFRDDALLIVASLVMVGLSTLLGLLQPFPFAILIDTILPHKPGVRWIDRVFMHAMAGTGIPSQILALAVAVLLLRVLQELLQMFQTLATIRIGYDGLVRVRCDLFRKLQALSVGYHRSQPQGDAIFRLSYDTFGFQAVLNVLSGGLINVITLVGMAVFMFCLNFRLTLVSLAIMPLLLLTMRRYSRILQDRSMATKEVDSELTTAMQRSIAAVSLVQAFGREAMEYERFAGTVRHSVATWLRLHWQEVTYWLIIGSIFGLGGAIIFEYGGLLAYKGAITAGDLSIFIIYLAQLYAPLNKLSASGTSLQGGLSGVKRVFEVLDRQEQIRDEPGAAALPLAKRVLELDRVSFEYRAGEPVLRDVTARIEPGQMVAFVGTSGVGKTTLLSLLPRFYDPTSGTLRLDGQDARKIRVRDLRRHVALVLQDQVILPTTIAENIAYGRPEASEAQIRHAAEFAGAADFIEKLPGKYREHVSESGANLSGGQRQRIAIARALLTESPILVLDEPTSALDAHHEEMIVQTLRSLRGLRTMIVVSHRLSTVLDCDRIYVMEEGRIVEQGTHDELVARRGVYFRMARHQLQLVDNPAT
jgi:subfamily B ATP-binding cassette protein MsbA